METAERQRRVAVYKAYFNVQPVVRVVCQTPDERQARKLEYNRLYRERNREKIRERDRERDRLRRASQPRRRPGKRSKFAGFVA